MYQDKDQDPIELLHEQYQAKLRFVEAVLQAERIRSHELNESLSSLERRLRGYDADMAGMETMLNNEVKLTSDLSKSLEDEIFAHRQTRTMLGETTLKVNSLEEENEELQHSLNKERMCFRILNDSADDRLEVISSLSESKDEQEGLIDSLRQELAEKVETILNLKGELADLNTLLTKAEDDKCKLTGKIESFNGLTKESTRLRKENKRMRARVMHLIDTACGV